jgi:hypothetical protein
LDFLDWAGSDLSGPVNSGDGVAKKKKKKKKEGRKRGRPAVASRWCC